MTSRLMVASLGLALLALTACGPTPAPTPAPTAAPTADGPTPSPTTGPSTPRATLVLPGCDDLFPADQITELIGEDRELNPPEGTGGGSGFPELVELLAVDGALRCTWVLPGSESAATVSIRASDATSDAAVRATMTSAGSDGTATGGDSILYSVSREETPDSPGFIEAHYLGAGLWMAAKAGDNAPALAQAAMSRMAELNPTWFAAP